MASKHKERIERLIEKVLKEEQLTLLKESTPADLLRLLQLSRELKETRDTRQSKENTIRWVDPEEE